MNGDWNESTSDTKQETGDQLPMASGGHLAYPMGESMASPSLPDQPVRTHQDVLDLIGEVERQLERLRTAQVRSSEELAHFADRGRRLDEREQEIHSSEALLTAREAQLRVMGEALHAESMRVGERTVEVESRESALSERERLQAERDSALRDRDNALSEREVAVEEATRLVSAERASLERAREEMGREATAIAAERDALRLEITSVNERLIALEGQSGELRAERDRLAGELDAARREGAELAELRQRQAEALAAAERNEASLMLTITQLRELNEDSESSLRSRDEVVESKDRGIAERDGRIVELEREVEMTRHSLRTAGDKLAALAKSVADSAPQLERGASALAMVNEQRQRLLANEARIAELEGELKLAIAAANVVPEKVVERVVETVVDTSALEAATNEVERLRAEIAAAERTAAEARASSESHRAIGSEQERALAQTQAKLAEAVSFLSTRKRRIDLARRLQRERKLKRAAEVRQVAENAMVRVLEEERLVKRQREELRQVQELLAASERDMVARYARHRGSLVAAWFMLVVTGLAAGAWFAAPSVLPSGAVASVDLTAKARDGEPLTPEADALFQAVHREALADDGLRAAVRKRLADRGVTAMKDNGEFNAWLDGVRIDSDGIGSMRLVAEGPDASTATIALDTLATTLVNESPKLAKGKGDVPRPGITGNAQVPGRMTFSVLMPQQGPWDRLVAAGLLFSGVATLGLITGIVVFGRIARAKRRFEDAERFGATL